MMLPWNLSFATLVRSRVRLRLVLFLINFPRSILARLTESTFEHL